MIPDADPVRRDQFISSPVSGDWRRIGGSLEMIAVCAVNTPGFPIPRARVAFSNGAQRALVGTFGVQAVSGPMPAPMDERQHDRARPVGVAERSLTWLVDLAGKGRGAG